MEHPTSTSDCALVTKELPRIGASAEIHLADEPRARLHTLFEDHREFVVRLLRQSGLDPARAEDGAQEVFFVTARRLGDIVAGKERAFLAGVAFNVARRLRKQQVKGALDAEEAESGSVLDDLLDRKRNRELLDTVLAEMEEDLRAVLVLADLEGEGKRFISGALGIPEGTVASRLRRARQDLAKRLERHRAQTGPARASPGASLPASRVVERGPASRPSRGMIESKVADRARLRFDDVRRLIRLAEEAREIGAGSMASREHFARGLAQIIGAPFASLFVDPYHLVDGVGPVASLAANDTIDPGLQRAIESVMISGRGVHPMMAAMIPRWESLERSGVVTARRVDLVTDRAWYAAPFTETCVRAGFDDCLLAGRRGEAHGLVTGIGLIRARGDRRFSEEHRALVDLAMLEYPWLFDDAALAAEARRAQLAPRIRDALDGVLSGAQDKEIAERMGISHHTVRQYVKAALRAFGVSSRAQLLARWYGRAP